jgi:hypothetical protein
LPKATVQLQAPTQPLGTAGPAASQLATLQMDDEEEESGGGVASALAIVGFIAALAVLTLQLLTANVWISAPDLEGDAKGDWARLIESE